MSQDTRSCGIQLMKLLEDYGTEFVFGIPGVHTLELYRGIAHSSIRHVTPRHEQSAGFMADGYARATGKVGVCCLITGPGVTNAATPLAQSYSDSVPILAISSVNKTSSLELGQGDLHELNSQSKLSAHFTAFSQTILSIDSVPEVIARAYATFNANRPRPVHVEIPIDLINNPVSWSPFRENLAPPPQADHELLKKAAQALANAKKPAVILGGGCKDSAAEATELIEVLNAPVVTTFAGKGIISEDHPLSLGSNLLHPPVLDFLKQADFVLAVGTHLSETDIWSRGGDIEFDGQLIRIDIDPSQLYRNAFPSVPILGNASHALAEIASLLNSMNLNSANSRAENQLLVSNLLESTKSHWYENTPVHIKVWDKIRSALPAHGIVTADSTQLVYSGNYVFKARSPRTYFTSTTGYGTLGYALPAAVGAQLGKPNSPVVCVIGDGGLMFTIQELATAVEHRLPIVIVLWHNDGYGEIRDYFNEFDVPLVGVDLAMPNFLSVAKAFGCHAKSVNDLEELPHLMQDGFRADRPTLLEIHADRVKVD